MTKVGTIRLVVLVLGMSMGAWAQTTSQAQTQAPPQNEPAPAPAFGQTAPVLNPENPPVTGLDEPSLDLEDVEPEFHLARSAGERVGGLEWAERAGKQRGSIPLPACLERWISSNTGRRAISFLNTWEAERSTPTPMTCGNCKRPASKR